MGPVCGPAVGIDVVRARVAAGANGEVAKELRAGRERRKKEDERKPKGGVLPPFHYQNVPFTPALPTPTKADTRADAVEDSLGCVSSKMAPPAAPTAPTMKLTVEMLPYVW